MWFFQHDHDRSWVWLRSRYAVWGCGYNAKARHAWVQGCRLGIDPFLQSRIKVVGILCVCFHVFASMYLMDCCDPAVTRSWQLFRKRFIHIQENGCDFSPRLYRFLGLLSWVGQKRKLRLLCVSRRWSASELGSVTSGSVVWALAGFSCFTPAVSKCVTVCHGVSECIFGNLWLLDSLSDQAWARLGCKRSCTAIRWDEGGTKGWAAGLGMAGFNYSN